MEPLEADPLTTPPPSFVKDRPALRAAVYGVVLGLYLLPLIIFQTGRGVVASREIMEEFRWHFHALMGVSFALSVLLFFIRAYRPLLIFFRIALFFLLAYPLGLGEEITVILLFGVLTEIALYLPLRTGLLFLAGALTVAVTLGKPGSAFGQARAATPVYGALSMLAVSFLYGGALMVVRWAMASESALLEKVKHLKTVITQLSYANLDFQRYVHSVEYSAVNSERRRISREIHDTVGYSLTNILMTLEAATDLMEKDPSRARTALNHSIREAQTCLEETRVSMRKMRSHDLQEAVGLQAIAHLARSFSEATGMRISVQYGNAPDSFGGEIDLILFRIVQEGITNAFRHGMAKEVRIHLWIVDDILHVTVSDNGRGPKEIVDGVGLSGMRERVESIGGSVSFMAGSDGFKVRSLLPLRKEEEVQPDG